MIFDQKK